MKILELLDLIVKPVILIASILAIGTLAAAATDSQSETLNWALNKLDLRKEWNLASWFESSLFLVCAMSFALIGWSKSLAVSAYKKVSRFMAIIFVFLSADEALAIHEKLGGKFEKAFLVFEGTNISETGFSWLMFYVPAIFIGFSLLIYFFIKQFSKTSEQEEKRKRAIWALFITVGLIFAALSLEGVEGFLKYRGYEIRILSAFEESLEIAAVIALTLFNTFLAKDYRL